MARGQLDLCVGWGGFQHGVLMVMYQVYQDDLRRWRRTAWMKLGIQFRGLGADDAMHAATWCALPHRWSRLALPSFQPRGVDVSAGGSHAAGRGILLVLCAHAASERWRPLKTAILPDPCAALRRAVLHHRWPGRAAGQTVRVLPVLKPSSRRLTVNAGAAITSR